jgi:putative Holliday junction resolvase
MHSERESSSESGGSPGERVLAIDLGERRVGLALAEPGRALVEGLPTVDRKALKGKLVDEIRRIALERAVDRVVLGIPLSMDGSEGPAARLTREFEGEMAAALDVPVEEWDERLSTEAARTRLREIGYSEREMRSRLDQLSAVLMLEGWLRARVLAEEREAQGLG